VKVKSTTVIFTVKFFYLQLPSLLPILSNSVTFRFHTSRNYTLPSNSNTDKFQDDWFTAKLHYLQKPLFANSYMDLYHHCTRWLCCTCCAGITTSLRIFVIG